MAKRRQQQLLLKLCASSDLLDLHVMADLDVPIYRQLADQVRRMAASGRISAGTELPSVRELAQTLAVDPMTVSKAYGLLVFMGLLERRPGLVMVIAPGVERQSVAACLELLRPSLQLAVIEAEQLGVGREQMLELLAQVLDGRNK